jgi:hypothetical protein
MLKKDSGNCSWWRDMFEKGTQVEIQDKSFEFYLHGKPSGNYARGIVEMSISDETCSVKLFCNGESHVVNRDILKVV